MGLGGEGGEQGRNAQSVPKESQAASASGPAGWRKAFSFMKEPLKCWKE